MSDSRPTPHASLVRPRPDLHEGLRLPVATEHLDELLLELILVDTVALGDPVRGPIAERLIERFLSPGDYASVLDRYDELSDDDDDDESELVSACFMKAAARDSHWKSKMLRWFTHIVGAGRPLTPAGLAEVASLAAAMNARLECQALYGVLFGVDPYACLTEVQHSR